MKKHFKGTNGEWKTVEIQLSDWSTCSVGVDKGTSVCHLYYEGVEISNEAKANAKLISASKELLNTVIELHELLEEHLPNWYLKKHDNIVKNVLEKALL